MESRIFVGVPAYRGTAHIAETLASIREQSFAAFDVLISVDNGDGDTARACEPFLSDPRFRLVVQRTHLGWDGNINWLMSECRRPYFCYWQQDDIATMDYLHALFAFAEANPDFVCTFCDVEWFGKERVLSSFPTLTGFALTRALYVFESLNGVPFRGLIRKAAIDRIGPIRRTEFESAHEDFVWLTKLARDGKFARVEGPLYYKRQHEGALTLKWQGRDAAWRRAMWMEFGVGMLEAILPVVLPHERDTALAVVLERLCCRKDGRFLFHDPGDDAPAFAQDFLDLARARCGLGRADAADAADADIIRTTVGFAQARGLAREAHFAPLLQQLKETGRLELDFGVGGAGTRLLETGWSFPEGWGTWSSGHKAALRLPLPNDGQTWEVVCEVRGFADAKLVQTVRVSANEEDVAQWRLDRSEPARHVLSLEGRGPATRLTFELPDAVSPQQLGRGDDPRFLAIGLSRIAISLRG